jgi:F-type H+-transporting ATPase subunit epsilon
MNRELTVEIVTQSGVQYQGLVSGLVAPGTLGYLGVRPGHAPLMTGLTHGIVTLRRPAEDLYAAITGGVMEVLDNHVTILADIAEMAEQIDVERARRAMKRAQERLTGTFEGKPLAQIDVDRAEAALLRAINRLRVVEKAVL